MSGSKSSGTPGAKAAPGTDRSNENPANSSKSAPVVSVEVEVEGNENEAGEKGNTPPTAPHTPTVVVEEEKVKTVKVKAVKDHSCTIGATKVTLVEGETYTLEMPVAVVLNQAGKVFIIG